MIHGTVIRGTTPTHDFELPYPMDLVDDVRVVYGQKGKALFVKSINDCDVSEGKISVSLIQEETFLFAPEKNVNIEVRIKLTNGLIVRNEDPIVLKVIDSMSDEVIE
jgi:hypothetical protein